jgi:hypothetical protein
LGKNSSFPKICLIPAVTTGLQSIVKFQEKNKKAEKKIQGGLFVRFPCGFPERKGM